MEITNQKKVKRVSFLVAGVQKGGTTALDSYLRQHPEICMATKKEIHFFDNDKHFQKNENKPNYHLYHEAFQENCVNLLLGESTPIYSYWKPAIQRIYNYNTEMKFIILLRNPVERAYSHWHKETINFHSRQGNNNQAMETLTFHEAIHQEKDRLKSIMPLQHRYYSYIDRGLYYKQINFLLDFFPMDQLLIIKSNWLRHNTDRTLSKVFDFLNIRSDISIEKINPPKNIPRQNKFLSSPVDNRNENPTNIGNYQTIISELDKKYLIGKFENDILKLEKLLDWNCHDWLD